MPVPTADPSGTTAAAADAADADAAGKPAPVPPPAAVAERVAASLAGAGEGRVAVSGTLPDAVLEALPAGVVPVGADIDGGVGGDEPPHTALLVLDAARDGSGLARRLGTACRRFPGRLLVWQRDALDGGADPVPVERFFAFGFRRVFTATERGVRHALHEYRLADYKQPPDWLNARYWANPERFGIDPDAGPPPGRETDPG